MAARRRSGRGARGAGLEQPQQIRVEADQGDVDDQLGARGDFSEEIEIPHDGDALARDAHAEPAHAYDRAQDVARDTKASLRRLIGIGRGADRDLLAALARLLQRLVQPPRVRALHVDARLELGGIGVAEILVGGPRVAVHATDLAAAIRIHRPAERHARAPGTGLEPVHQLDALELLERGRTPGVHDLPDAPGEARSRDPGDSASRAGS
jgi:hypothetical protein